MKPNWKVIALLLPTVLSLSGCGDTKVIGDATIDYKNPENQKGNVLVIPPDLINSLEPESNTDTYSKYLISAIPERRVITPENSVVTYRKEGDLRWIEIQSPPENVWPVLVNFWNELGFVLEIDSPETGIMETNWLQNRSSIFGTGFTEILDRFLGRFQDTGERDKYRTRVEPGASRQTTEVYITHRGIQEVATRDGYEFERVPNDPSLEVELLRRVMTLFNDDKTDITRQVEEEEAIEHSIQYGENWILVDDQGTVAWRRIAIALDRSGFTIAERSPENSYFIIRYSDERIEQEEDEGLLGGIASFFSNETAIKATVIRISLEDAGENQTKAIVMAEDGSETAVASDIIAILSEHI